MRQHLLQVFRRIGHASLPLGRLYEGHVNAVKLIFRYGGPAQHALLVPEVRAGRLFGVWNTEAATASSCSTLPNGGWRLEGRKIYASGAGYVERPLITARTADGSVQMVVPELAPGERADLSGWVAHGMRASATGTLDFTGLEVAAAELVGAPGDYLRQPTFSAGAWRFAAVHLGGIERLLDELRRHLARTRRDADPYQLARVGQAAMAAETARLWLERACQLAEDPAADARHGDGLRQSGAAGRRAGGAGRAGADAALDRARRLPAHPPGRAVEPRSRHLSAPAGARPRPGPGRGPRAGLAVRQRPSFGAPHDPAGDFLRLARAAA